MSYADLVTAEVKRGFLGAYLGGEYITQPLEEPTIIKSNFSDLELRLRDSGKLDVNRAMRISSNYAKNRPDFLTRLNILEETADYLEVPSELEETASMLNGTTVKEIRRSIELGKQGIWQNFQASLEKRGHELDENGFLLNNTFYTDANEPSLIVLPNGDLASHLYGFAIGFLSGGPAIYRSPRSLMHIDHLIADAINTTASKRGYDVSSGLHVMTSAHENTEAMEALLEHIPQERRAVMGDKETTQLFQSGIPFYLSNTKWIVGPNANLEEVSKTIALDANRDVTACDTPRIIYVDPNGYPELMINLVSQYEKLQVGNPLDADTDIGYSEPDSIENFQEQLRWRTSMGYETIIYPKEDIIAKKQHGRPIQIHPTLIKAEGSRSVFIREGDLHLNALLIREATPEQAIEEMQYLPESLAVSYFNGEKSQDIKELEKIASRVNAAHVLGHSSKIHDPAGPHERRNTLLELMSKTDLHY